MQATSDWIQSEEEEEFPVEYRITASPNDFNVNTLYNLIDEGKVRLPGFQRNYVWDIKKASRLIESIIMGLPVPQLFFYEKARNDFLVIDGQQRLLTVFYFIKGKFPREERRSELRRILDERGSIPQDFLSNPEYFSEFALKLGSHGITGVMNRLDGLTYQTLEEEDRETFGLRPIRCVVIQQHDPRDDDSSMYEIFFRLNTGGINLTPQEIRVSLYYSQYYAMLSKINLDDRWRRLTRPEPDLHMRDIEILLRGFAMLVEGRTYSPPMIRFLNQFSNKSKSFSNETIAYQESLFGAFLDQCSDLPDQAFTSQARRFSTSMYDAIFTAACEDAFAGGNLEAKHIDSAKLTQLKLDPDFVRATQSQTTSKANVDLRLQRARQILFS